MSPSSSGQPGYGAGFSIDSDLIRFSVEPTPWVARTVGGDQLFRGRIRPGAVRLPARPPSPGGTGIAIGIASRPIVLRSVGVAHAIPANMPWVVLSSSEWRIVVTEATDLRLVHSRELAPELVNAAVTANRPTRFHGRECKILRAAITSATPVWIDESAQPVTDLAATPRSAWRVVGGRDPDSTYDRDHFNAFLLIVAWALDQHGGGEDPRFLAVTTYIKTRLSDPALSTDLLAHQLRISRRTLQTLFESQGGVAAYIRRRRLGAALRLIIREPDEIPDLDTIARETGLGSRRTLERAMRQVYGVTPRQARVHLLAGNRLRERQLDDLEAS